MEHIQNLTRQEDQKIHLLIEKVYGYAFTHSCVDCGKRAKDWSWKHGENPKKITSYEPRCRSCHKKYDIPNPWWGKGSQNINAKLTEEKVIEIRKLYDNKEKNQYELAEMFCVSRGLIGQITRRESWKNV